MGGTRRYLVHETAQPLDFEFERRLLTYYVVKLA